MVSDSVKHTKLIFIFLIGTVKNITSIFIYWRYVFTSKNNWNSSLIASINVHFHIQIKINQIQIQRQKKQLKIVS